MNWQPHTTEHVLEARALINRQIRDFFRARNVLEVETPILNTYAVTDQQIESIDTERSGYLHTSPEYAMKRLLAFYERDIFQLCKVFRLEEEGSIHHCEFTMLEWYRVSWEYRKLMQEVEALIKYVLAPMELLNSKFLSFANAFLEFVGINIEIAGQQEYSHICKEHGINLHSLLSVKQYQELVLDQIIIPKLQSNCIYFIHDYPSQHAALARIGPTGFAERFECYLNGIELANGFQELTDASEQRARFEEDNRARLLANQKEIEIDVKFIAALNAGLPNSSGVALGVDRLLMLKLDVQNIKEVLVFPNG